MQAGVVAVERVLRFKKSARCCTLEVTEKIMLVRSLRLRLFYSTQLFMMLSVVSDYGLFIA